MALALGTPNVDELLERMSSEQLEEWRAYYELEPWGGERGDLQAGIVASALWNIYRDRSKQRDPFTPGDFMLKFEAQERKQESEIKAEQMTPEEVGQVLRGMFGG